MKMPDEAYLDLVALLTEFNLIDADGEIARRYRSTGDSAKLYRWNSLYCIPFKRRQDWFDRHEIYQSMNDDHIDTALQKAFRHNRDIFIPQKAAKV